MKVIAVVVQQPNGKYKLVGNFGVMHGKPRELADLIASLPEPDIIEGEQVVV